MVEAFVVVDVTVVVAMVVAVIFVMVLVLVLVLLCQCCCWCCRRRSCSDVQVVTAVFETVAVVVAVSGGDIACNVSVGVIEVAVGVKEVPV